MLVIYIVFGLLILYLFCVRSYYIQENLTPFLNPAQCKQAWKDQYRMGNPNARATSTTQYCVYDGQCQPTKSNYCGTATLDGLPRPVYKSLADCMEETNPFKDMSPEECLSKEHRGTCSGTDGTIRCYPGTPQGPNHEYIYARNLCYPSRQGCRNAWVYGYDESLWFSSS